MKKLLMLTIALAVLCAAAYAAPKTYQVTGPVLSINGDVVTVQKGTEKWEITVPKDTKGAAELKVGEKVTIQYTMTAVSVEPKGEAKKPAAKKAETKKAETATPASAAPTKK